MQNLQTSGITTPHPKLQSTSINYAIYFMTLIVIRFSFNCLEQVSTLGNNQGTCLIGGAVKQSVRRRHQTNYPLKWGGLLD